MADWNGDALRRWLWSAERFSERAMLRAFLDAHFAPTASVG